MFRKVTGPSGETVMFCQMVKQLNCLLNVCVYATGHSQKSPFQQQVTSESGHITGHTENQRWTTAYSQAAAMSPPPRPREPHRRGSGRTVETEGLEVCSGSQACPGPQNREGKKERHKNRRKLLRKKNVSRGGRGVMWNVCNIITATHIHYNKNSRRHFHQSWQINYIIHMEIPSDLD